MKRGWTETVAITAIAATLGAAACSDDHEQRLPTAPSPVPAATHAEATTNASAAASIAPNGITAQSTTTGGPNRLDIAEGPSGPVEGQEHQLPPGVTLAEGQRRAAARDAMFQNAGFDRRSGRPKDVYLTEFNDSLFVAVVPADHQSYRFEVDWNLVYGGGCDTSDCTEAFNGTATPGISDVVQARIQPRNRFTPNGWYWVWVRACRDADISRACDDDGYTWSHWQWNVVQAPEDPNADPEPEPVPIPSVNVSRGGWTCAENELCKQTVTVGASAQGISRFDFEWRRGGQLWSQGESFERVESFSRTVAPGYYATRARARHNDGRIGEWTTRQDAAVRPDYAAAGEVPFVPLNVMVRPDCGEGTPTWNDDYQNADGSDDNSQRWLRDDDPNLDYDWDNCYDWQLSFDAPVWHGGWAITDYAYGDVVYTSSYSRHPPAKRCESSWTPRRIDVNNSVIDSEPIGSREYGFNVRTGLPQHWTLALTAANGKGDSACRIEAPRFP